MYTQLLCHEGHRAELFRKQSPSYLNIKDRLFLASLPVLPRRKDIHFSKIGPNRYKILLGNADGIRYPAGIIVYGQNNWSPSFFPLAGYLRAEDIIADSMATRYHGLREK